MTRRSGRGQGPTTAGSVSPRRGVVALVIALMATLCATVGVAVPANGLPVSVGTSFVRTIATGVSTYQPRTDGSSVWVANRGNDSALGTTVTQVNAITGDVVRTIQVGNGVVDAVPDGSHVWVLLAHEARIVELDAATGQQVGDISLPNPADGFVVDGPRIWVLVGSDLLQFDTQSRSLLRTVHTGWTGGFRLDQSTLRNGHLWYLEGPPNGIGDFFLVDSLSADGSVVSTRRLFSLGGYDGGDLGGFTVDSRYAYASYRYLNQMQQFDLSTGLLVRTYSTHSFPVSMLSNDAHVWLSTEVGSDVQEFDVRTGEPVGSAVAVPNGALGLTLYGRQLWVANYLGSSITELDTGDPSWPSPPTGVTAVAGNGSATVSWSAPTSDGGSAITGYKVTPWPAGGACAVTGLTASCTGLTNGTAYTFTVVATNALGESAPSDPSATVLPVGVPSAPTNVTAVAGNGRAAVSWSTPASDGGSPITGYSVTLHPGGASCSTTVGVDIDPLTCSITGLTNGTKYSVFVTAVTAAGSGAGGTVVSYSAGSTGPAGGVIFYDAGSQQSWGRYLEAAPAGWDGPGYFGGGDPALWTFCDQTSLLVGASGTAIGTGADNSAKFVADCSSGVVRTVAAYAGGGKSDWFVPSLDEVRAMWRQRSLLGTVGSVACGYWSSTESSATDVSDLLFGGPSGGQPEGSTRVYPKSSLDCVRPIRYVSGLIPLADVTPQAVTPAAPTSVTAVAGNASASVSWTAPADNGGGAITSYTVTSSPSGASCVVTGVTANCTGLTNGTSYTFTVGATNSSGDSPSSVGSTTATPVGAPSAPTNVTAVAGNGRATISWAAPTSDGGSPVTGYSVTLSPGSASCSTTVGVDPNPLTCIVSGLTDGITYAVSVVATNAQGSGPVAGSSASPTAVQFVTGYQFGCVLSEGAVHCWGSSSSGTAVPSDLGQVTKLTDTYGGGEICALLASHTVRCWGGENYPGMNAWVQSLTDVYDVEVLSRACVVRGADRHVECFGQNDHGQSSPPSLTNVTNLALNSWESCAISSEQVSCWGWNHIGQGSPPAFPATPMKLVMGADTSCAVLANSELWCWGQNEGGQISPSQPNGWPPGLARGRVASAVTPSQVAVGWYTICLVDPSGTVQCSGGNGADPGGRPSITNAAALTGWYTNYCALTTDMAVSCWGPSVSSVTLSSSELLGLIGPPNVSPQAVAPSAPVGVTALAGNASASVSWTAPADDGGAAITSYTVTSSPAGGTCAVTGVTANCTGLTNGTAYTFTVVATNSAGNSPASAASATVTPATTPDAPTSVTATAGVRSASVSWTAPANNGGASITGYIVASSPSGASCVVSGTAASCTGLANATSYTFTVVATNRVGNSASSAASAVITTPGLPSAPTGVTATAGDTTVAVSWTAPASDGGSPITTYVVTSSPAAGSCVVTGTAAACSGLTNGTAYTFTVKARSAVGDSAASAASNSVTPLLRPNSPTALTVTPGNGLLTVKWTAATVRTGVAITGYTATATPGGFTCSTTAPRNGSAPTTCNIVGLVNGTSYVVSLVTNSANGPSPAVVGTAVAPRTVPGAPGGVTGVAGNGQVSVSWLAPASNGGSPITGYTVTSSRTSGTCTTTGALTCVVTGLTNGTSYTFTVKATNAAGTSIASSASAGVVPIGVPTAPRTVTATANTKTHVVTVKWSTPTSTGGASIVGYTATLYNALTGGTVVTTCTTSAVGPTSPATTCVMPAVAAGTYDVDVSATNASGFVSPASTPRTKVLA